MTSILKILTALFIFTIYTSSAGEFKPSTHNWNINPNNEDHQQADTIQVDRISKIKNTYKSNDVSTYNYQLEDIPKLKEEVVARSLKIKGHDNLSMFKNLLKYRHESKKQVCNSFTYFRGQI